jgi:peptide/nickel transport system substrate-binding protein
VTIFGATRHAVSAAVGCALALSASAVASLCLAQPAAAQKAKDTLRLVTIDPFNSVDAYYTGGNEVAFLARELYGRIVVFDEYNGKFIPELAKSYERINPTTIDFEIRDDLTFHSGNKLSAEDVFYTLNWAIDPKVKLRNKERYTWVQKVEKLGPNKVRLIGKQPFASDIFTIAYRFYIVDSKVHGAMADKANYGRQNPSTTGLYKVVSVDENQGVKLERYEPNMGKYAHRRAPIKHIQTMPLPDRQTQMAQLITGGVDMVREISSDMAEQLQGNPNVAMTPMQSKLLAYVNFDALGRSGNTAFKDVRVRQAFIQAIPRDQIVKTYVAGAEVAETPNAICFPKNDACAPMTRPLSYDPAAARKLLAEAGVAGGVEFELSVFQPYRAIAEAMAGELRKVGLRATVAPYTQSVLTKKREAGELTAQLQVYPTFAQPTMDNILNHFFEGGRDYANDPVIEAAAKAGYGETDTPKRTAIYQKAIDRVNEMAYVYPFSEQPTVYGHSKDVRIEPNLFSLSEVRLGDFFWR